MSREYLDEYGQDAYWDDWVYGCGGDNKASNGERVTAALALRIAADVLRSLDPEVTEQVMWTPEDMRLARMAIAGIRAQRGIESADSECLGYTDGFHATHQIDIWVYG